MRITDYGWWTIVFTKVDYITNIETDPSVIWLKGHLTHEQVKLKCSDYSRIGWHRHGRIA